MFFAAGDEQGFKSMRRTDYARSTGKVGSVLRSQATGSYQCSDRLATGESMTGSTGIASRAGTYRLIGMGLRSIQEVDIIGTSSREYLQIRRNRSANVRNLAAVIRKAFSYFRTGTGVVVVDLPKDIQGNLAVTDLPGRNLNQRI